LVERHILEHAVVEALGTDDYVVWTMEDAAAPVNSPTRRFDLFITYYSGGSNLVPHTPDVCYLGGGFQPAQPHENKSVDVPSLPQEDRRLPIRVLTFANTAISGGRRLSVVYTFGCNGTFAAGRERIRELINNPRNTYAYFSKVEVSFSGATREESIDGATRVFDVVLPVLIRDHWPDFEKAESGTIEG
jgi:hypothetical protein